MYAFRTGHKFRESAVLNMNLHDIVQDIAAYKTLRGEGAI